MVAGPGRLALALAVVVQVAGARSIEVAGQPVPVLNRAGVEYVPLYRLVEAYGGRYWQVSGRVVALLPGDSLDPDLEYILWPDSALVRGLDREYRLPLRPLTEDGQLFLPVLGLGRIFPDLGAAAPLVELVEIGGAGDTALVQFLTRGGESIPWVGETHSSLEYRLVIGARCDSFATAQLALVSILAANGLIQEVRVDSSCGTVLHFLFRRPSMVLPIAGPSGLALRISPLPERKLKRLALDPGHGGKDPGAIGRLGTLEKTIVLDMAQRLERKLKALGFEVLMTRSGDDYVSLSERAEFANRRSADLFVSIHANASPNRSACGFETYFLSEAKTDWERAVAARENASLRFEAANSEPPGTDLELILADLAQNEYLTESSELAAAVQQKTVPTARIMNRGVRQAGFYVLRNNYMPAVLVECGFLTNSSEEKLLRSPAHRERLADGVLEGILEFVQSYERRVNGT